MTAKFIVSNTESKLKPSLIKNSSKIVPTVKKYIDKNNDVLFDIGPIKRLLFLESDKDFIFDICNISSNEISKLIKDSPYIDKKWKISGNSFNMTCVLAIRELELAKKHKEKEAIIIYLTLAMYSSVHFKFFPKGEPNANIMAYTINNLSNKYLLKQEGVLFKAIYKTAMKSHETYKDDLIKGEDGDLALYVNNLRIRLDNLIKNVAVLFYQNHKEGNYLNREKDNYDEEEYHIADNSSFAINRIADAATMRFVSRGVDHALAKKVAQMNNVSINAVRNALNDLQDNKSDDIKVLFTNILELYLSDGSNTVESIRGLNFIIFCMNIYSKSNTNDDAIIKIKDLLDNWLKECSPQYRNTERIATLSSYRKAIFTYFVFLLSEVSKSS